MKELTPLQKTIWNLAMTGGKIQYNNGQTALVDVFNIDDGNDKVPINVAIYSCEKGLAKPILHSLNKITETMMQGVTYIDYLWFEVIGTDRDCFNKEKFYEDCESGLIELLPIMVFDQLRQCGFNIENLNPDEFIEKSTLKL